MKFPPSTGRQGAGRPWALMVLLLLAAGGLCGQEEREADERAFAALLQRRQAGADAGSRAPTRYALLCNEDPFEPHTGNIDCAYRSLRNLGFAEQDLLVLAKRPREMPVAEGQTPIHGRFTKGNFVAALRHFASVAGERDLVFVYVTGHGRLWRGRSFKRLDEEYLAPAEYAALLAGLHAPVTVSVMDQCFSGAFVEALEKFPGRGLAISDTDASNATYCEYFSRAFCEGLKASCGAGPDGSVRAAFEAALREHRGKLIGRKNETRGRCLGLGGIADVRLDAGPWEIEKLERDACSFDHE